jgi:hypothetical protein
MRDLAIGVLAGLLFGAGLSLAALSGRRFWSDGATGPCAS